MSFQILNMNTEEDGYSNLNHLPQHPSRHYMSVNVNQGRSLPFAVWLPAIFILSVLCLALIIGMIVLGLRGSQAPVQHNENLRGLKESLCSMGDTNIKNKKEATWLESKDFCFSQNSTLLTLKRKSKLIRMSHILQKQSYWIGLSYRVEGWSWTDDTKLSTQRMDWIDLSNEENCAYLYYHKLEVHSEDCYEKYPWICEKAAVQLI
ncbi:C-type lectin domain family 1 member B-like isoform X2 [Anas platyrhynchos]|uniref:C-type lectin domain family 1 member B-like isoform X2 n=1 Tax=Anas platyrhynchos TaxID=8839 RepID=UPI0003509E3E|nr:natural killer cells antigen CD94-like isoform X2 [Anas platyrhynchos]|eukprot:XP_005012738.1 natural killer cells antigen CD94-like isoform X2 [Anas platyrhynchos]